MVGYSAIDQLRLSYFHLFVLRSLVLLKHFISFESQKLCVLTIGNECRLCDMLAKYWNMLDEQEKRRKNEKKGSAGSEMYTQMAAGAYVLPAFRRNFGKQEFACLGFVSSGWGNTFQGSVSVNRNLEEISLKSQYLKDFSSYNKRSS